MNANSVITKAYEDNPAFAALQSKAKAKPIYSKRQDDRKLFAHKALCKSASPETCGEQSQTNPIRRPPAGSTKPETRNPKQACGNASQNSEIHNGIGSCARLSVRPAGEAVRPAVGRQKVRKKPAMLAICKKIWYGGAPPEGGVQTGKVSKRNLVGKEGGKK